MIDMIRLNTLAAIKDIKGEKSLILVMAHRREQKRPSVYFKRPKISLATTDQSSVSTPTRCKPRMSPTGDAAPVGSPLSTNLPPIKGPWSAPTG